MSPRLRNLFGSLVLAAGSVLFLLLLLELALRVAGYSTFEKIYAESHQFWEDDAILGWAHRKGVTDAFVGPLPWPVEYEAEVSLNALGLRGDEIGPREEGELRILFTGDSRTAGFEVENGETFAALLAPMLEERLARRVVPFNAGVRGYGTDQSLLAFREHWRALDPDLVVHMHSFNDPVDNIVLHQARRIYGKAAFRIGEDGSAELVGVPVPIYPRCAELRLMDTSRVERFDTPRTRFLCRLQLWLVNPSALLSFLQARIQQTPDLLAALRELRTPEALRGERLGYGTQQGESGRRDDPRYELTRRLLSSFGAEVEASGADFVLAGYGTGLAEIGAEDLRGSGLDVVDISSIEEGGEAIRFVNDVHWNVLGHRRVAEALVSHLAERLAATPEPRDAGAGSAAARRGSAAR